MPITAATADHRTRHRDHDRRPLVLLLIANAGSITGSMMTLIAVPWFVLESTGSAAKTGLVAACATVPLAMSALLGGPVIDRLGRRRTSVISDLVCGAALLTIPLLHLTGVLHLWHLCVLTGASGLFHSPGETARSSLVPDLATHAGLTLPRVTSLHDGTARGARMGGAALAGLLVAAAGATSVMIVDAATFALSAALIGFGIRPHHAPRRSNQPRKATRYTADLAAGYRYLFRQPLLRNIVLMVLTTNALEHAWTAVLLPSHARAHLNDATAVGLVTGLTAGGALVGALTLGAVGDRLPRWQVFTTGYLLTGIPRFAIAGLTDTITPLLITACLAGFAAGALNPIMYTTLYETVPDDLRARVLGACTAGVLTALPIGALAGGYLVEHHGLRTAFLVLGGLYLLATLSPLLFPSWRAIGGKRGQRINADRV